MAAKRLLNGLSSNQRQLINVDGKETRLSRLFQHIAVSGLSRGKITVDKALIEVITFNHDDDDVDYDQTRKRSKGKD
ncbi:hypothetical protein M514_00475 [Trichuris suis]|uniref:Uncharacterized protein n=1 Tax=Trichuris suis TaxID=68888 RepID=A0A085NRH2_9BILA|nr:hypothetical protein M514_00475 [Trichuris suis]